jgi:hypothetical protein
MYPLNYECFPRKSAIFTRHNKQKPLLPAYSGERENIGAYAQ